METNLITKLALATALTAASTQANSSLVSGNECNMKSELTSQYELCMNYDKDTNKLETEVEWFNVLDGSVNDDGTSLGNMNIDDLSGGASGLTGNSIVDLNSSVGTNYVSLFDGAIHIMFGGNGLNLLNITLDLTNDLQTGDFINYDFGASNPRGNSDLFFNGVGTYNESAAASVSEGAILPLFGLGLMGLGFAVNRRTKSNLEKKLE